MFYCVLSPTEAHNGWDTRVTLLNDHVLVQYRTRKLRLNIRREAGKIWFNTAPVMVPLSQRESGQLMDTVEAALDILGFKTFHEYRH